MSTQMAELTVAETAIPGLLILDLPLHGDARGWFKENWQRAKMTGAGLPDFRPVQNNISFNELRGTTRGFHAEPWDKYVSVATGKIFGAWVDLRPGESFGELVTAQVGPGQAVFVPRGVANGFQTLEDHTAYTYLVTEHWSETSRERYSYVNLGDPTLEIDWPVPLAQAILSEADRGHPNLSQATPVPAKRILVLGGGGQLGQALAQRAAADPRLHVLARAEADLCDPASLDRLDWSAYSHVVNAAAYTAVDAAETPSGRKRAWQVNAQAVQELAARCVAHHLGLVHVSTDYVFDGMDKVYAEESSIAPLGVYGQSKAAGETAVGSVPRHYLVRTSWVVGKGANFVDTMTRLAHSDIDPLVVDDQVGRLTFADDLAAGILHLIDSDAAYGTYNIQGGGQPLSWYRVAQEIFALCGQDPQRVGSTTTAEYASTKSPFAPRPAYGVLDTSKIRASGYVPGDQLAALKNYVSRAERR
ncbi:sugar nucleotide-binding protein [Glutamicibacter sp. AOP3-A1-12]|uniref:sugar nucleotide-binding protein n=1 Tax=Glutamicibacter sp. AOP3-A1-12 TaxID=3457701 RepID=UPI0040345BEB